MNSTIHTTPSNARPGTAPADPAARSPGARDERRLMRYVGIVLAAVVLAVLAFNLLAPRDRLLAPHQAPTAAATAPADQRPQPATTAPGDGTMQRVAPDAADSPTPTGREGMGAPQGAVPQGQPSTQDAR